MLLHIANNTTRWTTLDPWVIALGLLAFAALVGVIWSPRRGRRIPLRRPLRRAASISIRLAVFAALLPSVLPYDHILPTAQADNDSAMHAAHCHDSPGSCSDAPVSAGAGQFLASEPLLVAPALVVMLMLVTAPLLRGIARRPEVRPPMALAFA